MLSNIFYSFTVAILCIFISGASAFVAPSSRGVLQSTHTHTQTHHKIILSSNDNDNLGVIDLTDDDDEEDTTAVATTTQQQQAAPFLSQGELSDDPNLLNPDFNDAKQSRVIFYIILTLVPILFLVPLMIGSRDLIPLDSLPPVEFN